MLCTIIVIMLPVIPSTLTTLLKQCLQIQVNKSHIAPIKKKLYYIIITELSHGQRNQQMFFLIPPFVVPSSSLIFTNVCLPLPFLACTPNVYALLISDLKYQLIVNLKR